MFSKKFLGTIMDFIATKGDANYISGLIPSSLHPEITPKNIICTCGTISE
jgi:hypothetical protein